jgi:hypothetical protein
LLNDVENRKADDRRIHVEFGLEMSGPVCLIVNWMLIDGLRRNGHPDLAERIRRDSLALVERSGFARQRRSNVSVVPGLANPPR